jgi:hypothetical protein
MFRRILPLPQLIRKRTVSDCLPFYFEELAYALEIALAWVDIA